MISLFLPLIISAALGSLDPSALSDPSVSGSDFIVSEDIQLEKENDFVKQFDDPILLKSVTIQPGYYNDDFVGWNYRMYRFSSNDKYLVLLLPPGSGWYNTTFYPSNRAIEVKLSGMDHQNFAVDYNDSVITYTYSSYPSYYRFTNPDYPSNGTLQSLYYGTVQSESDAPSLGGDSIDYSEILQSIDDRLSYFEDLFYYGSSIDDMGNGFKVIIVLIFLVTINIVLKIINWR